MIEELLTLSHDGVALDAPEGEISYFALGKAAGVVRDSLTELGVGRGHLVALLLERDGAGVAGLLGCIQAGACALPLSPLDPPARLEALLSQAAPSAVLARTSGLRPLRDMLQRGVHLPACLELELGAPPQVINGGSGAASKPVDEGAAMALYTTGHGGAPRGVVHSRAALDLHLAWAADQLDARPRDRVLAQSPLCHHASLLQLLLPLSLGARAVLPPEDPAPGPLTLPRFLEQHSVTMAYISTHLAARMSDGIRGRDLSAMRHLLMGGAPPAAAWLRPLMNAMPAVAMHTLHGSPDLPVLTHHPLDDDVPREPIPVGSEVPGMETQLNGAGLVPVSPGEAGEIWATGPGLPLGHLHDSRLDSILFVRRGGRRWMRTRDLAYREASGNLVLVGRRDRALEVDGARVDPAEVEATLLRCPEVTAAAVVDLPHPRQGRALRAAVRGDPAGEAQLALDHCARMLPEVMVPERLLVLERFPRTVTGGVDYIEVERLLS